MAGERIVVGGYIVRGPLGGMVWHHLQYVIGLADLGYDVWFLEDSDDYASCYDPSRGVTGTDPTYGLAFARDVFDRVGLGARWGYFDAHGGGWLGPAAPVAAEVRRTADIFLNLSGVNPVRDDLRAIPERVLVDTDPLFVQVRHLDDPAQRARAATHTHWFSFGENIARRTATVPVDDFPWQATRQPVSLGWWAVTGARQGASFTEVMQWASYPPVEHAGRCYGMKSHTFPDFEGLPAAVPSERFELALGSSGAPRERLTSRGWNVVDPLDVAGDPWSYQCYINRSKAEFGVAKHGYVAAHTGWFSERTAAYLASGRPAIVQDTGFSDFLPTGLGLHAVSTLEEAATAVEVVVADYPRQCRAAREIAEAHFDGAAVLSHLLDRL